ncbi:hypothetical protein CARUB_v10024775mg [Capsella rubella]|uniref:Uncharacterized protein n=1 Tax=Capsella rubella TaxID=81985 RepID=R0HWW8_9BRAS|nr:uncharacterized protein LOC17888754 [Capsella rubella]EOA28558.1 hypothetical protein CARUB_v10024775mg [Capsella rubella]
MGKTLSMTVMMVLIVAAFVIGGEAKSEVECSKLCRPHCQRSSSAAECTDCHRKCEQSPPAMKTDVLKNQHLSSRRYGLAN